MQQHGSIAALVSCPQECHQIQASHLEEQQVARGSVDGAVMVLCAWQENARGGKFSSLQDRRKPWCVGGMHLADELPTCFGIQGNCGVYRQVISHRAQQLGGNLGDGGVLAFLFCFSQEPWDVVTSLYIVCLCSQADPRPQVSSQTQLRASRDVPCPRPGGMAGRTGFGWELRRVLGEDGQTWPHRIAVSQRGYSPLCLTPAAVGGLPPAREGWRLGGGCSRDVALRGEQRQRLVPMPWLAVCCSSAVCLLAAEIKPRMAWQL